MPHPSHCPALRVPTELASGAVATDQFGLTILPLGTRGLATRPPTPALFGELDPPHPETLAAFNPSPRVVTLAVGDTVVGGMSDRAVAAAVSLPPRASAVLTVEPLSARWWPAHRPHPGAPLPPALTALLILATHGGTGLRSIARTALWEGYRRHAAPDDIDSPSGWLLLRGRTVLGAHLVRGRVPGPLPMAPSRGPTRIPHGDLLREGGAGTAMVRLTYARGRQIETWLVRMSAELVDAVLAGASD